jgi:catechol 2,3-dioxygenase-like lactoylglutathione lyase family enzyme
MAIPARVSIVTLAVSDLEASAAFYERWGWTRAEASNDQIVWFATSDSVLGLFPRPHLAEDAQLPPEPTAPFGGFTLAINLESVEAVDVAMQEALDAGAPLLRAAEKVDWGGYRGYVGDPDGHPWELAHNPYIAFNDDGSLDLR